jgi:hypothetical protein
MLREAVAEGTLGLDQPEALPQGLAGLYQRWFWHRFPSAEDYGRYVPLLSVLVAAAHPVPEAVLAEMFGWSKRERANMLEGLGSLFERRPEGMAPFHKSLRDWLTDADAAGAAFVVDEEAGAKHLFDYLWSAFEKWAREPDGPLDAFCLAELPVQTARWTAAEIGKRIPIELFRIIKPALIRVAEMRSVGLCVAERARVVGDHGFAGDGSGGGGRRDASICVYWDRRCSLNARPDCRRAEELPGWARHP